VLDPVEMADAETAMVRHGPDAVADAVFSESTPSGS